MPGGVLPEPPAELRRELLRRLDLVEREVRALAEAANEPIPREALNVLVELENSLRLRLASLAETADWAETRAEIIDLWRQHRQAFERLARDSHQRHSARSGRRDSGPRW